MHPLTLFLQKYLYWLLLAVLALNLFQRRYQQQAQRKRFATLYLAMLVLAWMFEFTPEGLRRQSELDRAGVVVARSGRRLDYLIALMLLL